MMENRFFNIIILNRTKKNKCTAVGNNCTTTQKIYEKMM